MKQARAIVAAIVRNAVAACGDSDVTLNEPTASTFVEELRAEKGRLNLRRPE